MPKALQIFNGRGYCCRNLKDPRWVGLPGNRCPHAYVAAYSLEDARRVIFKYCGKMPPAGELRNYFSKGAWGSAMSGVTPERGLWLQFGDRMNDMPERVL